MKMTVDIKKGCVIFSCIIFAWQLIYAYVINNVYFTLYTILSFIHLTKYVIDLEKKYNIDIKNIFLTNTLLTLLCLFMCVVLFMLNIKGESHIENINDVYLMISLSYLTNLINMTGINIYLELGQIVELTYFIFGGYLDNIIQFLICFAITMIQLLYTVKYYYNPNIYVESTML